MRCPNCGLGIDAHPANRCFNAWVAERIMGWKPTWFESHYEHGWTPSTDIAAAGPVMEKALYFLLEYEGGEWRCELVFKRGPAGHASAPTPPLAICRAALKATESENK